jgi:hypothetical protein
LVEAKGGGGPKIVGAPFERGTDGKTSVLSGVTTITLVPKALVAVIETAINSPVSLTVGVYVAKFPPLDTG